MASTDPLHALRSRQPNQRYCPECGQPLSIGHAHAEAEHGSAVPGRSLFIVVVGLYLSIAFGFAAWGATQTSLAGSCNDVGMIRGQRLCDAGVRDLALVIASGKVSTADAFAARTAEQSVRRDERFVAVGLVGIAVGLGGIFLRRKDLTARSHVAGVRLWTSVEWLLAFVYAEIVVFSAIGLVPSVLASTPITWDSVRDTVDRVLTGIFSLVGGG